MSSKTDTQRSLPGLGLKWDPHMAFAQETLEKVSLGKQVKSQVPRCALAGEVGKHFHI